MISPSPIQPPPTQTPVPTPEHKLVPPIPRQKRLGETAAALTIKSILRPLIKGLYYLTSWTRNHKLSSLGIILLLIASISATTYYLTDELPFGIGHDPFNFSYNGGKGEGALVKDWLYSLRDGNTVHLQLLDKDMSQKPDIAQLVALFSQTKSDLRWRDTKVIAVNEAPDTTVDSFVQVTFTARGPGNESQGVMLWHFITASVKGQDLLLNADLVSMRPLLA